MQDPAFELPRIHLLKLSERGRRSLRCSLTEHRNGAFRPIFASQHVQIRGQSIARTPFRTVSERSSRKSISMRSEEHTSELQSRQYLVCRLLLEKKKTTISLTHT